MKDRLRLVIFLLFFTFALTILFRFQGKILASTEALRKLRSSFYIVQNFFDESAGALPSHVIDASQSELRSFFSQAGCYSIRKRFDRT